MFSLGSLKSLKPYIAPYKNWMIFSLVMAIPLALVKSAPVLLLQYFVDDVLVKKDLSKLLFYTFLTVGISVVNFPIRFFHYYSIRMVVVNVNQRVREKLYEHLISLSADFFSEQKAGVLLSRVTADPANLDNGIASMSALVREPVTFLALLIYVLRMNWRLTILTFVIVPGLAFVFGKTGKYIKHKIKVYQIENGETYGLIQEALGGIRVIHHFNLEKNLLARFSNQMTGVSKLLLKISKMEELSGPSIEVVTSIASALILYYGGGAVIRGDMTTGDLLAFIAAFGVMINPIRQMADINSKLHSAAAAMERIDEFLSWEPKVKSELDSASIHSIKTGIEFKNVSFAYPDTPDRKVLKHVNFSLPLGKTVALVGQSGSGKSSIVQLLTRLYDVTSGSIQIDGVELKNLNLKQWRDQVAVVSQDVFLFHDTIYKNILLGKPTASHEEVMEAARKAFAFDFVSRLPQGFETLVGDRGVKLSGGERQRISIARAFLKDSPCLILDEATSNLDNESEKLVQQTLEKLMQHRTTLVIAHRLSTIQNADHIIVMKQGEIQEHGTYAELMKTSGEFERLVSFADKNPA